MTTPTLQARPSRSGTNWALSNMRGVAILIVLAFHSMLAYLDWLPPNPIPFSAPPYKWQAFPVVDQHRWFGFDLFCAWQDVCLMSIMFFLSGLFVWPSLRRKGSGPYLLDRLLRIGLPSALILLFVMPVTFYPAYHTATVDPSVAGFWQEWRALPFWACGHLWFIWQLLAMNVLVAALHKITPRWGEFAAKLAASARAHPARFFGSLASASAAVYVPMAFLFTPWDWYLWGPVGFQFCRPLHYVVYFFAGAAVGAYGFERGLAATDGLLARRWALWTVAALIGFGLWAGFTGMTLKAGDQAPTLVKLGAYLAFVLACATGCFAMVAVFVRFFAQARSRVLDSLSENAYGMYLAHYVFVVWLQFAMLPVVLFAAGKVVIVLVGSLIASWTVAAALSGLPLGARLVGAKKA